MRKSPIKRYWRVWRFDGYKTTFEKRVDLGQFTENQIKELLRALESRSLSDDEIIGRTQNERRELPTTCYTSIRTLPILHICVASLQPQWLTKTTKSSSIQ